MRSTFWVISIALASGCVDVPEESRIAFEYDGPDAGAGWALALDGGRSRPPTAEPYDGPECSPAASAEPSGSETTGAASSDASGSAGQPADAMTTDTSAAADAAVGSAEPAGPVQPALPGEVIITELMPDPDALSDVAGEWIELYNASASALELGGCSLIDGEAEKPLSGPLTLLPDEHRVLARSSAVAFTPAALLAFTLNNGGDRVALTCGGTLIDEVVYDSSFPSGAGTSLSLSADAYDADANDRPDSYCPGREDYGGGERGTPGARNPVCTPPLDEADDAAEQDADAGMP